MLRASKHRILHQRGTGWGKQPATSATPGVGIVTSVPSKSSGPKPELSAQNIEVLGQPGSEIGRLRRPHVPDRGCPGYPKLTLQGISSIGSNLRPALQRCTSAAWPGIGVRPVPARQAEKSGRPTNRRGRDVPDRPMNSLPGDSLSGDSPISELQL